MPAKRRPRTSKRSSTASGAQTPNFFDRLEWRSAGPYRGGRGGAVAGDPRGRNTFYFGSTGGRGGEKGGGGPYWGDTTGRVFKGAARGGVAGPQAHPNAAQRRRGRS